MLRCRILGHAYRFSADGPTMTWRCERDCGAGGTKTYASDADAGRYAAALDRRDTDDLGRRAPLLGLFPMRVVHLFRRRR